jgi:hypothetical protein
VRREWGALGGGGALEGGRVTRRSERGCGAAGGDGRGGGRGRGGRGSRRWRRVGRSGRQCGRGRGHSWSAWSAWSGWSGWCGWCGGRGGGGGRRWWGGPCRGCGGGGRCLRRRTAVGRGGCGLVGRPLVEARRQRAGQEVLGTGRCGRGRFPGSAVPLGRRGAGIGLDPACVDVGALTGGRRGVRISGPADASARVTADVSTGAASSIVPGVTLIGEPTAGVPWVPARTRTRTRTRTCVCVCALALACPPVCPAARTGPLGPWGRHRADGTRKVCVVHAVHLVRVVRVVRVIVPTARRGARTRRSPRAGRRSRGADRSGGRGEAVVQGVGGGRGPRVLGGVVVQLPPPVVLVTGGPSPLLAHAPNCPPRGPYENGASGKCFTARVPNSMSSNVRNSSATEVLPEEIRCG